MMVTWGMMMMMMMMTMGKRRVRARRCPIEPGTYFSNDPIEHRKNMMRLVHDL
jgi:hypothetical protein